MLLYNASLCPMRFCMIASRGFISNISSYPLEDVEMTVNPSYESYEKQQMDIFCDASSTCKCICQTRFAVPAGRRLFLKPSLPSDCFIVRTTVFPTRLLQLWPSSSRTFVMSNCDHGLAQLRLPVLIRGVHA